MANEPNRRHCAWEKEVILTIFSKIRIAVQRSKAFAVQWSIHNPQSKSGLKRIHTTLWSWSTVRMDTYWHMDSLPEVQRHSHRDRKRQNMVFAQHRQYIYSQVWNYREPFLIILIRGLNHFGPDSMYILKLHIILNFSASVFEHCNTATVACKYCQYLLFIFEQMISVCFRSIYQGRLCYRAVKWYLNG